MVHREAFALTWGARKISKKLLARRWLVASNGTSVNSPANVDGRCAGNSELERTGTYRGDEGWGL